MFGWYSNLVSSLGVMRKYLERNNVSWPQRGLSIVDRYLTGLGFQNGIDAVSIVLTTIKPAKLTSGSLASARYQEIVNSSFVSLIHALVDFID